jgi:hypothetical protein
LKGAVLMIRYDPEGFVEDFEVNDGVTDLY